MVDTAPVGRRDRNRERLYDAAIALFAERGYEATTMDDIAARAGLSRRSAFNHFPAKSDLSLEWTARRREAAFAAVPGPGAVDPAVAPDAVGRVRAWFRALGELTDARPRETEQVFLGWYTAGGPFRHPTGTAEALVPWIEAGIREGVLAPDLDAELAAALLVDAYLGVLSRWFLLPADTRGPVVDRLDAAIALVLDGQLARTAV
jgi:AcrR family transcriptional regulator